MEAARQFYYNAWFMWVHPPLLFFSYGAFVISFVATLLMIRERHSAFETTAYRWARLGYLSLTAGMLLGFPWALMSWQGESWWWSGKVNMSIMMWVLYTAYLHARLYLRTRGHVEGGRRDRGALVPHPRAHVRRDVRRPRRAQLRIRRDGTSARRARWGASPDARASRTSASGCGTSG